MVPWSSSPQEPWLSVPSVFSGNLTKAETAYMCESVLHTLVWKDKHKSIHRIVAVGLAMISFFLLFLCTFWFLYKATCIIYIKKIVWKMNIHRFMRSSGFYLGGLGSVRGDQKPSGPDPLGTELSHDPLWWKETKNTGHCPVDQMSWGLMR